MLCVFLFLSFFIVDLGFNSNYFIKKDFVKAFNYRLSGDCEAFKRFVNIEKDEWKNVCEDEKNRNIEPIREYKIQIISHSFGSDKAFIQVELKRNLLDNGTKEATYSVNYELRKIGSTWKIDQKRR